MYVLRLFLVWPTFTEVRRRRFVDVVKEDMKKKKKKKKTESGLLPRNIHIVP